MIAADENDTVTLLDSSVNTKSLQFGESDGSPAGARHLTVRGFTLADEWYAYAGTQDVTLDDITAAKFYIRCGHDITISDGTYSDEKASGVPTIGPTDGASTIGSNAAGLCPAASTAPTGIVIEDNLFYRIWTDDPAKHREALHIMGVDGLLVRRNEFRENLGSTAAISINEDGTSTMEDILIESNLFYKTYDSTSCGGCTPTGENDGINIGGGGSGAETAEVVVRFNTFYDSSNVTEQASPTGDGVVTVAGLTVNAGSGIAIDSNIFDGTTDCGLQGPNYTWRYNVKGSGSWATGCDDGNNEVHGTFGFVDAAGGDLHLSAGAFSLDEGNPTNPPATDIDRQTRTLPPDAGADQQ